MTSRVASLEEKCSESAVIDGTFLQDQPEMTGIVGHMLNLARVERNVDPAAAFRFTGRRVSPAMGRFIYIHEGIISS